MKISGLNLKNYIVFILFLSLSFVSFSGVAFGASISVLPDVSLFVQIANFLIIIWVLNIILYRPIRKILIERKEKITSLEQNVEKLNEDAAGKDEAFLSGIKDARTRGLNEKEVLLKEALRKKKRSLNKLIKRLRQILRKFAKKSQRMHRMFEHLYIKRLILLQMPSVKKFWGGLFNEPELQKMA